MQLPPGCNDTYMNKASACWRCNNRKREFNPLLPGEAIPAAPDEKWREEMIGRVRMCLDALYAREREDHEEMLRHLDDPD